MLTRKPPATTFSDWFKGLESFGRLFLMEPTRAGFGYKQGLGANAVVFKVLGLPPVLDFV